MDKMQMKEIKKYKKAALTCIDQRVMHSSTVNPNEMNIQI